MENDNKEIEPNKLPQNEAFKRKEVFQHKQPADAGKPMDKTGDMKESDATAANLKEEEKTSKEEGLNEQHSAGNAGAFEGFEDQQKAAS